MLRIADTFIVENPKTVADALELLERYGESARVIAGGTDLLPNIKHGLHAPEVVINLKAVEGLREIDCASDQITIGALVPLHTLATNADISARLPALSVAAGAVAGPQLRRMGTLGGNICLDTRCVYINQTYFWRKSLGFCVKKDGTVCHVTKTGKRCVAAASNDTAPVLMTLDATLEIVSPRGLRHVALNEFYVADGIKNNSLEPDEILTRVLIPNPPSTRRMAFEKLRVRSAIDFPMLNLGLAYDEIDGIVSNMDLVISAIAARPRRIKRLPEAEAFGDALVEAVCELAYKQVKPLTSINGDVIWRRQMIPVLVRRAFAASRQNQG
jgi:4-hydroxybenzoyl-CoA reductase subunit beta